MGQRHRQRRAAATHRARAGASDRPTATAGFTADGRYDPRAVIDDLLVSALRQLGGRPGPDDPNLVTVVARIADVHRDDLVDDLLVPHLVPLLADVWERGWSPTDLVHAVAQRFDPALANIVAAAVLDDPGLQRPDRPDPWTDQLERLRQRRARRTSASDVGRMIDRFELVTMLLRLPKVVPVVIPPSQWRAAAAAGPARERTPGEAVDPRMLERVRALLAKAESTGFEAEAEAFMGKAQELMAKYAIDAAMVSSATADARSLAAGVEARRLHLDDPYAAQKAQLLGAVASVNGGHVVWHEGWGFATVVGFPVELELTELTFTSLLVQMTRAMATAGAAGGRTRSASFRRAFVLSYAQRIGERLEEARRRVSVEADQQYGGALVPVQQARRDAVEQRAKEWFPRTAPMRSRTVDAGGWYAGRSAADLAELEPGLGEIA